MYIYKQITDSCASLNPSIVLSKHVTPLSHTACVSLYMDTLDIVCRSLGRRLFNKGELTNLYLQRRSPGRVKSTSSIELTTWQTEAPQARLSRAISLETFIQFYLRRVQLNARDPERGSRPALSVLAGAFSWSAARLRREQKEAPDQLTQTTSTLTYTSVWTI